MSLELRRGVAADARRHMPPVLSARASFVARGLGARPGQWPVAAEQDLRGAVRGVLAGPVAAELARHPDQAGWFAATLADAGQHVLIHGFDGPDLGGLVVDDDERAVLRREQMVGERVADGLTCHEMPPRRGPDRQRTAFFRALGAPDGT